MTPERGQQISALFHAARALQPDQRPIFLAQVSADDDELRREVEALLAGDEQAGDFLNQPAQQLAASLVPEDTTSFRALPAGREFGHYRILSHLGAGGMGEVYLAEDTQLERRVALKFLPANFTAAAEPVRRFIREAKAASALNHPNIITIHEIGQAQTEAGKLHFIVTEYIDGQTLRARMQQARMKLGETLEVAVQAASALAAAHEAGIIHRDIKPENVMLRRDGYVKVLDFGLAKLTELRDAERGTSDNPQSAIRNPQSLTASGMVMGTARYMSPEQARGQAVDARTDIFSFGVMLYEMLAGRAPFAGVNAIEVIGAMLHQEPAPLRDVPDELQRIVARTLRKECAERYQTVEDLLVDLKDLKHRQEFDANPGRTAPSDQTEAAITRLQTIATDEAQLAQTTSSTRIILGEIKRHKLGVALMLVLVAIIGVVAYRALRRTADAPVAPFSPVLFSGLPGREYHSAFSPDGNQLAFSWDGGTGGNANIYIKLIGVGTPLQLTRDAAEDVFPTWSPDGRYIAFQRVGKGQHEVLIVPALGGPERRLCTVDTQRIAWSPDGKWLAVGDTPEGSSDTPIVLISVESGEKKPLTRPPSPFDDSQPAFSPDGQQVVFVRTSSRTTDELYVVSVNGGSERQLTTGSRRIGGADWTPDGREIVYSSTRAGKLTLWRVPVTGGEPAALPGIGWDVIWPTVSRRGGLLAFTESYDDSNILRLDLSAQNRHENGSASGALTPLIVSKRGEDSPQVSPDGLKIAFASDRSGSAEIWVCDRDGGNPLQVTRMRQAEAGTPRWSPDGQRLVFDARPEQSGDLFVINASGGAPQRLTTDSFHDVMPSWSRDSQWIYFCSNRGGDYQIWKMPVAGGNAVQMTRHGGFEAFESLDGQTLYYSKWRGIDGLWSVPAAGGTEQPVPELTQGGYWRAWAVTKDGIYYVAHTGSTPPHPIKFFSFATRQTTQLGVVEKTPPWYVASLTVAPDGQWLLYSQADRQVSTLMLVENFR